MGCADSTARIERTAMCWRALPLPALLLLLILALPHISWAQRTTQLRRSCVVDSQSALCCSGDSSEGDARVRTQLAGVVSAFRENEAYATQLGLNLTAAVERYRVDVTEKSQLAERSVGRLSLQHDMLDDRLTTLGAALRNGSQMASIAAKSELLALKNEMRINMTSLRDAIKSELNSTNCKINVSADQLATLFMITAQQTSAINQLNRTQHHVDAIWGQQVSALRVQLNSVKSEMTSNMSSLAVIVVSSLNATNRQISTSADRLAKLLIVSDRQEAAISQINQTQHRMDLVWRQQASALGVELNSVKGDMARNWSSLAGALESVRYSMNDRLNVCSNRTTTVIAAVTQHATEIGNLNRTQQQSDASWKHQALNLSAEISSLKNEMRINMTSLTDTIRSELYSTNENINVSADEVAKLLLITGQQAAAITQLNQTQHRVDAIWGQQVSALGVQLNSVKGDMARNWSSLAGALESVRYSMTDRLNASSNQTNAVIAVVNQHTTAIGNLNRTQQQSDASWKRQVLNLSAEISSLSSNKRMVQALSRVIEQQMQFSTRILLSTVTAVCSFNRDLMSSVPQCQSINSLASTMTSYNNDVSSEMRTLRQQVGSDDPTVITSLQRRSEFIQREMDAFTANISQVARTIPAECKAPWVSNKNSCYYFGTKVVNQNKANEFCLRFRGHLVRVDDLSESVFLRETMLLFDMGWAWIGLVRHPSGQGFVWSSGGPVTYTAWIPDEPNQSRDERCVQMFRIVNVDDCTSHNLRGMRCARSMQDSLYWADTQCGNTASFICERPL